MQGPAVTGSGAAGTDAPLMLIVEDDESLRRALAKVFSAEGYEILESDSAEDALIKTANADSRKPDLIVCDYRLKALNGLELLSVLRERKIGSPFILITAYGNERLRFEARMKGVKCVLDKPFRLEELKRECGESLGPFADG